MPSLLVDMTFWALWNDLTYQAPIRVESQSCFQAFSSFQFPAALIWSISGVWVTLRDVLSNAIPPQWEKCLGEIQRCGTSSLVCVASTGTRLWHDVSVFILDVFFLFQTVWFLKSNHTLCTKRCLRERESGWFVRPVEILNHLCSGTKDRIWSTSRSIFPGMQQKLCLDLFLFNIFACLSLFWWILTMDCGYVAMVSSRSDHWLMMLCILWYDVRT